jgi:hypothetical protein
MANLMDMDIYCVKNMKMKRTWSLASLAVSSHVSWHCGRTGQNTSSFGPHVPVSQHPQMPNDTMGNSTRKIICIILLCLQRSTIKPDS